MPRVKRGTIKNKRRKNVLAQTKGYRNARKSKLKQAKQAIFKAGTHAFAHRRKRKNDFRRMWQVVISYAVKEHGLSYSKFINLLKTNNITLNRKMLAHIIKDSPETFDRIVEKVNQ